MGNPFSRIVADLSGRWASTGASMAWPATYLIDGHGIIRDMVWGGVTDEIVKDRLMPEIEKAKQAS